MGTVRIIRAPIGEAPDWVRQAWIGLELPTARPSLASVLTVGVTKRVSLLTCLRVLFRMEGENVRGYLVPAAKAVDVLVSTQPAAAAWWREHAPHLLRHGRHFVFDEAACEPSDG